MKNKFNRGFTLIELLVVIAIIGILSSVVLASLNTARTKGADASVKANLNGIRAQAELYYDNNSNSYGSAAFAKATCAATANTVFSDTNIFAAITQATTNGGGSNSCMSLGTPATAWAAAVALKTSGTAWCVDSSGNARSYTGTPTAAISATATCN